MFGFPRLAGCAVLAALFAFDAEAASLNITGISGIWSASEGLSAGGLGTNSINWGKPATGAGKSGYEFDAAATPMNDVSSGSLLNLGTFIHHNKPIFGPSISGATLTVSINIEAGGVQKQVDTSFKFKHLESRNNDHVCANGGAHGAGVNVNGCADRVTAELNLGTSESFLVGDDEYVFVISGFKIGLDVFSEFWTTEMADNAAILQGSFIRKECVRHEDRCKEPAVVPLPATGGILFAGLAALAALSRRRKAS